MAGSCGPSQEDGAGKMVWSRLDAVRKWAVL